ncbi:hypothetical protein RUA4292_01772 [Ruegeria atlantica]|uniref:Uncharacterized protein n=1 Tax=Ruegeria atlantica TaxID=81569 RepID=A0A0P1ED16_9RHOB|nr:hypothetical protein RUA4292_01772 [Ruegeria atlantica]
MRPQHAYLFTDYFVLLPSRLALLQTHACLAFGSIELAKNQK